MTSPGKARRLQRLSRWGDGRYLFVPMDHSISDGPPELVTRFGEIAVHAARAGADAVIAHKGRIAQLTGLPETGRTGLIVHLSAGTSFGLAAHSKVVVGTVGEAAALGADAVSVHINLGCDSEPQQLVDVGAVATQAEACGMPLLVMVYTRGPNVPDETDARKLAHAVNVAVDLGADLVKTSLPRPLGEVGRIIDASSKPLIFSGGSERSADDLMATAETVMSLGAAGFAVGRRAWTQPDPGEVVGSLAAVIHPAARPDGRLTATAVGVEAYR